MRVAVGLGALLVLAGCSAPPETPDAEPSPSASVPVAAPSSTPQETVEPAEDLCVTYQPGEPSIAPGAEVLAQAAASAQLPEGVTLNPGMQIITSVDRPGEFEAVARLCSDAMTGDVLAEAASAIAVAIAALPERPPLAVMKASAWEPAENGYLDGADVDTISTDFELYTWDPNAGPPLATNWD